MDTESHASIELHNESDGIARSEERSPIESSSLGLVYDYLSDADTGTESQGINHNLIMNRPNQNQYVYT